MKNVVITGASGNLGSACVQHFLQQGWRVVAADLHATEEMSENFEHHAVNLTDEIAANTFVQAAIANHSSIDAALLLVGGFAMGSIADTTSADVKKQLAVNFETAYHIARPVFAQMLQQQNGGRIVLMGGRAAIEPDNGKNTLAYALAKSLLFRLAEMLNEEGRSKNVSAIVVVPSIIDTPQNRVAMPAADYSRWVKPEDLAAKIFAACKSPFTETVMKVYGGLA